MSDDSADSPFQFNEKQRKELGRIAPELEAVTASIEQAIRSFAEKDDAQPSEREDEEAADHAALYEGIAHHASALIGHLERLATLANDSRWQVTELLEALAHHRSRPEPLARKLGELPSGAYRAFLREDSIPSLAVVMNEVGALAAASVEARDPTTPPPPRGQPPKYDKLIAGLEDAVAEAYEGEDMAEPAQPDWAAAWTPWTAPAGRFCRLVGFALEAVGQQPPSNIAQLVRRALGRAETSFGNDMRAAHEHDLWRAADQAKQARWQAHLEQKCDAATCVFCS